MSSIVSADQDNKLQADASAAEDDCSRDALQHDNPATMAQPPNAHSSRLEALSDELLSIIIEDLVYDETRSGWSTRLASRDDLRHLCRVSRRMDLIARPYLYKKVTVTVFDSLAKLHRTLSRDPYLADEIREIDLGVSFGSATFKKLTAAEYNEFWNDFDQFRANGRFPTSSGLVGELCYAVLARAVKTRSLRMVLENTERGYVRFQPDYFRRLHAPNRRTPYSQFFDRVRRASRPNTDGVVFLPRVETVTLCSLSRPLGIEDFGHFLGLPSLKTVKSCYDDGNWCTLAPGRSLSRIYRRDNGQVCTNITTLRMPHTYVCQFDIEYIARVFPCLQVLETVSPFSDVARLAKHHTYGAPGDLSSALGKMDALQTLKLSIYPIAHVTDTGYTIIVSKLGPGTVLSLAQLPNLEHLEVPLYMLARTGVGRPVLGATTAVPREVLPKSLKSLVLLAHRNCVCWDQDSQNGRPPICWDSLTAAFNFFESLRDDLACFPGLKTVAYCFTTESCARPFPPMSTVNRDDLESEDSIGSRLRVIRASFLEQNVQFCLQTTADQFTSPRTIDVRDWDD